MSASLDRVLSEIRTLAPEDLQHLRDKLDEMLAAGGNTERPSVTEDAFAQHLLAKGMITRIPSRTEADCEAFRDFQPVEVSGEPVSETIIKERR